MLFTNPTTATVQALGGDVELAVFDGGTLIAEVFQSQDTADNDEGAGGGSGEQEIGGPCGDEFDFKNRTAAEKFAYSAQHGQGQGEAEPHTGAVQHGTQRIVFGGECFSSSENDAVDYDKGDEYAQRLAEFRRGIRLHKQVYDGDKGGDDHDVDGDADFLRCDTGNDADDGIAADKDAGGGKSHAQAVGGTAGDRQSGTGAEEEDKDGIFLPDTFDKIVPERGFHSLFSPLKYARAALKLALAELTISVTARLETVAPVR